MVVVGLVALAAALGVAPRGDPAVLPGRRRAPAAGVRRRRPPDLVSGAIVSRLLLVLPFIAIPVLMAVLTGSTGLAFLLTLLLFVGDVAITGAPLWATSPVPWVPAAGPDGVHHADVVGEANHRWRPSRRAERLVRRPGRLDCRPGRSSRSPGSGAIDINE